MFEMQKEKGQTVLCCPGRLFMQPLLWPPQGEKNTLSSKLLFSDQTQALSGEADH